MHTIVIAAFVGAVMITRVYTRPRRHCPNCGIVQPRWRVPTSLNQGLWGGRTCPNCGTEMDGKGRPQT